MPSFVFEWLTASMGRPPLRDVFFSVVRVQRARPTLAGGLLRRHSREFDPLTADKFTRAVAADGKCHRRDGFDQFTKPRFAPPHGFVMFARRRAHLWDYFRENYQLLSFFAK